MPTLYQLKPIKLLTFHACLFVIFLRYAKRDGPVDRFNSFVQVKNRTAEDLASVLKQELALAFQSIHKDVTAHTPIFNQKVIELFGSQKSKRAFSL
jgi:hypothetical protein